MEMKTDKRIFKVAIYDLEGYFITVVNGIKEASELTKASRGNISSCINGMLISSNNFQFRRAEPRYATKIGDVSILKNGQNNEMPVAKYFEGKLICVYSTLREAEEKNNINSGSISISSNKGYKAGIYYFKIIT